MSDLIPSAPAPGGEFLFYQTDDGRTRPQVRLDAESVWLSLNQLTELFQRDKSVVSRHISNLFDEGDLVRERVVANSATTAADGKTYRVEFFNLDVIISVGYRVKSQRGLQFRIWATQRLREYIVKGFAMDDERLKQRGGGNYFEELLARIRDIQSSEKEFWRKGGFTRRALITALARRHHGNFRPGAEQDAPGRRRGVAQASSPASSRAVPARELGAHNTPAGDSGGVPPPELVAATAALRASGSARAIHRLSAESPLRESVAALHTPFHAG